MGRVPNLARGDTGVTMPPPHSPAVGPKIARPSGVWAREKLELLRYYLGGTSYKGGGFLKATMRAGKRYYLDLFAGSGECEMEDGQRFDGSPLIAAKGSPSFTHMSWVDANARNAASLRAHATDFPSCSITVVEGDANSVVGTILSTLPQQFPVLAFLDPEGSELHWSTIQQLARHKGAGANKIELFILFAYNMGIVRFFPRDPSKMTTTWAAILDRVFPDPQRWRAAYERRRALTASEFRRLLLDEYVSGLKRLGYKFVPPPRLIHHQDGRALYFMVFATDHHAGLKIMEDAFHRVQPTERQLSLLSYDQRY
jgi:three-Cys-motif partner protein